MSLSVGWRWGLVLVASLVAGGCVSSAGSSRAAAPVEALESARGVRVIFEGNREVPNEDLQAAMAVARPETPGARRHETLERDALMLHALYYDRGFLAVTISAPAIEAASGGDVAEIRFTIHEGPRFHVSRFDVHDEERAVVDDLRARFRTHEGDLFSRSVLVKDLDAVRRLYRDAGYADVEIEPQTKIDQARAVVAIDVPVRRHGLVTIGEVVVVGNRRVPTERLRAELDLDAGGLYSQTKIERAQRRLEALPFVQRIDVSTEPAGPGKAKVIFAVHEGDGAPPP